MLVGLGLACAAAAAPTGPAPAVLTAVELTDTTPGEIRIVLEVRGPIGGVESSNLGEGRFVFDLARVTWDGPTRRVQPGVPGIREYRYSQLSRDPLITRFVVETAVGWSCRHEPEPRGLVVRCSGSPAPGGAHEPAPGAAVAVVRGIALLSPVEGLDAAGLIGRSLGYVPRDMVRDGLPHFGAVRDDWLGAPRPHKGLDIYGDGVGVRAAAAGRVAGAGLGDKAGGWVRIDHGKGVETVYVHISAMTVRPGDEVEAGQRIAAIDGPKGNAVEAQLHFEIKLDGRPVDPVPYLFELAPAGLRAEIEEALQRLAVLEQARASRVRLEYHP
ncbi:MAG TPA: M23 family metallopeptidase [Chondromyces sp.]|nr:M23 family metallopeptidase [Chondromyces sp.]